MKKKKILIIFMYFIILFLFELIFCTYYLAKTLNNPTVLENIGDAGPLLPITIFIISNFCFFMLILFLSIVCFHIPKLKTNYKNIIYTIPIITIIFAFPMYLISAYFANYFGLFGVS